MPTLCAGVGNGITCDEKGDVVGVNMTNAGYDGVLPSNIGDMRYLRELRLPKNGIQAPLPPSFASLSELRYLDISNNELGFDSAVILNGRRQLTSPKTAEMGSRFLLEGNGDEVFSILGQLTSLEYLDISTNNLRGAMTDSLCGLTNLETLYLSALEEGLDNGNNYTCVAECFYLNPNGINMRYDTTLPYCGQTGVPTVEPTNPRLSKSSEIAAGLDATQMGGMIAGIILFILVVCCILYYFTCYSNTSPRKMDDEFRAATSYIDVDALRKNHLLSEPSIGRIFDDSSMSGFESSESDEDGHTQRPQLQVGASKGRLAYQPSSTLINDDSSVESEDEVLQQWNEELADFHRANSDILSGNYESFGLPAGKGEKLNKYGEEVDSTGDCNRIRYTVQSFHNHDHDDIDHPSDFFDKRGDINSPSSSASASDSDGGSGIWNIGYENSINGSNSRGHASSFSDDEGSHIFSRSDVGSEFEFHSDSEVYSDTHSDVYINSGDEDGDSPFRERLDESF